MRWVCLLLIFMYCVDMLIRSMFHFPCKKENYNLFNMTSRTTNSRFLFFFVSSSFKFVFDWCSFRRLKSLLCLLNDSVLGKQEHANHFLPRILLLTHPK
jgi:hypothetical protein